MRNGWRFCFSTPPLASSIRWRQFFQRTSLAATSLAQAFMAHLRFLTQEASSPAQPSCLLPREHQLSPEHRPLGGGGVYLDCMFSCCLYRFGEQLLAPECLQDEGHHVDCMDALELPSFSMAAATIGMECTKSIWPSPVRLSTFMPAFRPTPFIPARAADRRLAALRFLYLNSPCPFFIWAGRLASPALSWSRREGFLKG